MPGRPPAAAGASGVARQAARGLIEVLARPDRAPAGQARQRARAGAATAGLAAATAALGMVSVASLSARPARSLTLLGHPPLSAGQILLAIAVVTPLPLAARYPLLGWRIGWLGLLLAPLVPGHWWGGWPWGPAQLLALLAAFGAAGARRQRAALWCMWALTLLPWWLWLARDLTDLGGPAGATLVFTAATVALDSVSSRLRAQRALAVQADRAELEHARRAVLEERARIARELHDVVAHHLSLIAVRAETAPYRLTGLPEPVAAEFSALSEAARAALADMRRLLGVLRSDQPAERAPQPELSDLPVLIDTARRAGVPVELSAAAALDQVPAGVSVCAYRIVQESLSNASQHAPGAAIMVSVDHGASAVRLRVANGPGRAAAPGGPGRPGRPGRPGGPSGGPGRPRAGRDAGAGRPARRLAVGGAGARRRLRGIRGPPGRPRGMTTGGMTTGGMTTGGMTTHDTGGPVAGGVLIRCLIADDQAMVREGFAAVLAAQPGLAVAGQAADGAEAVSQARRLEPDVILMDVRMPVLDGLAATRQILGAPPGPGRPRVLMLTTFDLDAYVFEALRAGASGFLLKDARAAELVHAVRVIAAGDALLAPSVTRRLIADFARRPPAGPPAPATLGTLTPRETEVLTLIARGLSNAEISGTLVIAEQTTKTHVGRILAKLDLRDRAQAVVLAYESGLVTPGA